MIRCILTLSLLCGCCLLAHNSATADPGGDSCVAACQQKNSFIGPDGQKPAKLRCWRYAEPGYCLLCTSGQGRCKDPGGPTLPSCIAGTDQVNLDAYSSDACVPICNLLVGQSAEATEPTGNPINSAPVPRLFCTAP